MGWAQGVHPLIATGFRTLLWSSSSSTGASSAAVIVEFISGMQRLRNRLLADQPGSVQDVLTCNPAHVQAFAVQACCCAAPAC